MECAICLDIVDDECVFIELPFHHRFHKECHDISFTYGHTKCALCRRSFDHPLSFPPRSYIILSIIILIEVMIHVFAYLHIISEKLLLAFLLILSFVTLIITILLWISLIVSIFLQNRHFYQVEN